jgi:hypothetical protein
MSTPEEPQDVVPAKVRCPHCKGRGVEPAFGQISWTRLVGVGGVSFPCSVCNGKGIIDSVKVPGEAKRNWLEFGASLLVCLLLMLVSLSVQNLFATFRFLNA